MNKEKCKEKVSSGSFLGSRYQCSRKPVKDGYCKQHHPETVKARREKSDRKWKEDSYRISRRDAFWFVQGATEEDLKLLSEAINKKLTCILN